MNCLINVLTFCIFDICIFDTVKSSSSPIHQKVSKRSIVCSHIAYQCKLMYTHMHVLYSIDRRVSDVCSGKVTDCAHGKRGRACTHVLTESIATTTKYEFVISFSILLILKQTWLLFELMSKDTALPFPRTHVAGCWQARRRRKCKSSFYPSSALLCLPPDFGSRKR